jgi:4-amino-4-deoxy-L-arabinose transferase-like glycosyltransferase
VKTIRNQNLIILFFVAFALRLAVFWLYRPWDIQVQESFLVTDSMGYHKLALCIVNDFSYCGETFRTPGWPFFIAIFYAIFGIKPWIVFLAQIFVDLVTIYYVVKVGEVVFSRRVGMIAAAFFAIDPSAIIQTQSLYSDPLFVSFLWASLYFYLRGLKLGDGWSLLIAGVLLGLTTLVRPTGEYYAIILLLFALLWSFKNRAIKLRYILAYGLAFAITISPWLYRNYTLYDTAKLSTTQGYALLDWQVALTRAGETHQSREAVVAEFMLQAKELGYLEDGNPFMNDAIKQKVAVQYIKTHPQIFVLRWISGIKNTYINLSTTDIAEKLGFKHINVQGNINGVGLTKFANQTMSELVSNFFTEKSLPQIVSGFIVLALLLVNYTMFLLGVNVLIKQGQWAILALFGVSIIYFTVIVGPIGVARYKLPIEPFYLLIGGVYLDQLLSLRAARRLGYQFPKP